MALLIDVALLYNRQAARIYRAARWMPGLEACERCSDRLLDARLGR